VRLLLDAHFSGRVIGRHFRSRGHDVLALDEHRDLEGVADTEVFGLAVREDRILITHNVQDFPDILRQWAEAGREHAGCIIPVGAQLDQFGLLIRLIQTALDRLPDQQEWVNRSMQVGRSDLP